MALLEICDLHIEMASFDGRAKVLNGIDLRVERGEIWGWSAKVAVANR